MGIRFRAALLAQVLICVVLSSSVGCKPPPNRVGLNDKIARATRELYEKGQSLRKNCEKIQKGKPADLVGLGPSIANGIDQIGETLKKLNASFEGQAAPARRSLHAQALVDAFAEFLKIQNDIYNTQLAEVKTIVNGADFGPGSWGALDAQFQAAKQLEDPAYKKLLDAQKEFADEHWFRPVPTR